MSLVQDDHVVQAFATDTPDEALHIGILPRTPWGDSTTSLIPMSCTRAAERLRRRCYHDDAGDTAAPRSTGRPR